MISSENVQNVPAWETAHRNQLDLESGNHQLYIVNGGHYIWYTNLTQVVQLINEWRNGESFLKGICVMRFPIRENQKGSVDLGKVTISTCIGTTKEYVAGKYKKHSGRG